MTISLRQFAKLGGKARAAKLTPERRKEIAAIAAKARWAKKAANEPASPN